LFICAPSAPPLKHYPDRLRVTNTPLTSDQIDRFLGLANQMADAVRPVVLNYFRTPLDVDYKSDKSPVSIADREAETTMRAMIEAAYPDHGIVGEEFGNQNETAEFVWVLDPIDGTLAFVTGKPLFGTLIALLHNGVPVLGVIDMPALSERWIGASGRKTLYQGKPASVRACTDLASAWIFATSPHMFSDTNFPRFEHLRTSSQRALYGSDCYAYGQLASGWTDIVCEDTMQPYDFAALVPVVEGAGGIMTDWQGQPLTLNSDGTVLATCNKNLHALAVEALKTPLV
jgi:inositol-phosphate phosphatase/L-galactose 1-phosphate phosphatase/histidinol-phosphatase